MALAENYHMYECKTEDEARRMLLSLSVPESEIESILQHESAHFNRARELSYVPAYLVSTTKVGSTEKYITCSVGVNGVSPQDSIDIALAPEEPSLHDLEKARIASLVIRAMDKRKLK